MKTSSTSKEQLARLVKRGLLRELYRQQFITLPQLERLMQLHCPPF